MPRQPIKGIQDHPNQLGLSEYSGVVPEGVMRVRLDDRAWGKSGNLFCYFSKIDGGEKYCLSVWYNLSYRPAKGGPPLDEELIGAVFEITVALTRTGYSKLTHAKPLTP